MDNRGFVDALYGFPPAGEVPQQDGGFFEVKESECLEDHHA